MRMTNVKILWLNDTTTIFKHTYIEKDNLNPQYIILCSAFGNFSTVINREQIKYATEITD